jgi:acyl dehydratase
MANLSGIEGSEYGPFHLRSTVEKIEEFVVATGDDPGRWEFEAPPGFLSVALFKAAPHFFDDPVVAPHAATLVHVDQTFEWLAPIAQESDLWVSGRVASLRRRGEMAFVTFGLEVAGAQGPVALADSTFLMTPGKLPTRVDEEKEPAWDARKENDRPAPIGGADELVLQKSASRADLVRYAGATRDWNPIHWDHRAAVEAGLPGIVTHGLLMAAWVVQAASQLQPGPHPLTRMRLRFRKPLRPGVQAAVQGRKKSETDLALTVTSSGEDLVTADATLNV